MQTVCKAQLALTDRKERLDLASPALPEQQEDKVQLVPMDFRALPVLDLLVQLVLQE